MKLLHQHNHLKVSVMYLALRLSDLCSTTVQDPPYCLPQLGKREEESGVRIPVTHHLPGPEIAY